MNLLLTTILFPLIGAALIFIFRGSGQDTARRLALATTAATLICTAFIVGGYPASGAPLEWSWLGSPQDQLQVSLSVGLDGISLWLFALSPLLFVSCVLVSWEAIADRCAAFYSLLLILETGTLGVFAARDLVLFYVFFEFTLVPLFFLIGVWGSEERRYAAQKFFIFTLAGSVLTLLGLLTIVVWNSQHSPAGTVTFSIAELTENLQHNPLPRALQLVVFWALFAGFAIKVPLFPLHTWLPLAHVQAPTAGSVILAGVLLKIGTYGFVRFSLAMLPQAAAACMPIMLWLAAAGIVYGALVALVQRDIKRLIAYSSVSHLGFCMLGLFALNPIALQGGILQMVNHGLSTGGLFMLVGMIYERYHTRDLARLGGIAKKLPWLAFFMLVMTFSSIGLPGLNGFVGEFLILLGMFQSAAVQADPAWMFQLKLIALVALSGVVLGAWYMLYLVQQLFFGPLQEPDDAHDVHDLSPREIASLVPIAVFVIWIGIVPRGFLDRIAPDTAPALQARAVLQQQVQASARNTEPAGVPNNDFVSLANVGATREESASNEEPALIEPSPAIGSRK